MSNNKPKSNKSTKVMQIVLISIFAVGALFGTLNFLASSSSADSGTPTEQYENQSESPF